jgi:hypothetical protein
VLDSGQLARLLNSPFGPVAKQLLVRGNKVATAAKRRISNNPKRVDTGRLRNSIGVKLTVRNGTHLGVEIGTNVYYARWVHEGTGIYGPHHKMIVPRRRKSLRWRAKGQYVFAKHVRGMAANPFLRDALKYVMGS